MVAGRYMDVLSSRSVRQVWISIYTTCFSEFPLGALGFGIFSDSVGRGKARTAPVLIMKQKPPQYAKQAKLRALF